MTELNYDLIPEELIKRALDYCVKAYEGFQGLSALESIEYLHSMTAVKIGEEVLATQQTKKPVDMQVLVDSGIWCEFDNAKLDEFVFTGYLSAINNNLYILNGFSSFKYCRPLYGHWHSVKNFDDVEGLCRELEESGFVLEYSYCPTVGVIEHFRITGMQPDRCEPWKV